MEVAHGEIKITLNDEAALAGLHRTENEFTRAVRRMDGQEAVAKLDADIKPLEAELKQAKRMVRDLEGERAEVEVGADTSELDKKIALAKRAVKSLDGQVAEVEIRQHGARETLASVAAVEKAADARAKAEERRSKGFEAAKRREAQAYKASEAAAFSENRARSVGAAQESARMSKLRQEWAKGTDQLENLARARRKVIGLPGSEVVLKMNLKEEGIRARMMAIKAELNALGGHPPVEIKVDTDQRGLRKVAFNARRTFLSVLNKAAGAGDLRLNLGPISGTIKSIAVAASFLSPVILSVVGAAGSLVSVLGSSLVGVSGLGVAALGGLGAAFLGVKSSMGPLVTEYKTATAASKLYHKAVLEHGAGSKQAAKANEKLQSVMKGIDPVTKQAIQAQGKLSARFHAMTDDVAKKNFGTIMTNAVGAASKVMPAFANLTKRTLGTLGAESGNFFNKVLDKNALAGMFSGFSKALPNAVRGLASFGQGFARVGAQGAKFLPQMTAGFKGLGDRFSKFAGSARFGEIMKQGFESAKNLVHFLGAAGRVLAHFFEAGIGPGNRFLNTMTAALNKYDKFLKSAEGQSSIGKFFDRAVDGTLKFAGALGPLLGMFIGWSNAMQPIVAGVMDVIGVISRLVAAISSVAIGGDALRALGITIATVFAIGKLAAVSNAILRIASAFRAAREAETAFAAVKAFSGALSVAGGAAPVVAGAGGAGRVATIEAEAAAATGGAAAARGLAGSWAMVGLKLAGVVGVITAAGLAIQHLTTTGHDNLDSARALTGQYDNAYTSIKDNRLALKELGPAMASTGIEAQRNTDAVKNSVTAYQDATKAVRNAKKGTPEYTQAIQDQRSALLDHREALIRSRDIQMQWGKQVTQAKLAAYSQVHSVQNQIAALKDLKANGQLTADGQALLERTYQRLTYAQNIQAATTANMRRQYAGLLPVTGKVQQNLGALARAGGQKLATTIAVKYEAPKDVGRVTAAANSALKSGLNPKQVVDIVARTQDAEAAIRSLNAVRMARKIINILANATNAIHAHNVVKALPNIKKLLTVSGVNDVALRKHRVVSGLNNVLKTLTILGNNTAALNAYHAVSDGLQDITKTLTIITAYQTTGSPPGHSGTAMGGVLPKSAAVGSRPRQGVIDSAAARAAQKRVGDVNGGVYSTPRYLVGEENQREYVIATNPSYRQRNTKILGMAARDMGMTLVQSAAVGYQPSTPGIVPVRGRGPQRPVTTDKKGKKHPILGDPTGKHQKVFQIPDRVYFGGEPEDRWGTANTNALGVLNQGKNKVKSANTKYQKELHEPKPVRRKGESAKAFGTRKSTYNQNHAKALKQDYKELTQAKSAIPKMQNKYNYFHQAFLAIHAVNQEGERMSNTANYWRSEMDRINKSPDYPNKSVDFDAAKKNQSDAMVMLNRIKEQQLQYADKASVYYSQLLNEWSANQTDIQTNEQAVVDTPAVTMESFIKGLGKTPELQQLEANVALAKTTPGDMSDDRSSTSALANFYGGLLGTAKATGSNPLITEVANAFSGAQSDSAAANALTPDEEARKTAGQDLARFDTANRIINAAFAGAANGPGDYGTGGYVSGAAAAGTRDGTGPTIIINTLHPGDPNTLAAIGSAAAAGFGYQGYQQNPRGFTGL